MPGGKSLGVNMAFINAAMASEAAPQTKGQPGRANAKQTASKSKYRNQRVDDPVYGKFDSRREHTRWLVLCQRQRQGEIKDLKRQVTYELRAGRCFELVCKYIADATYWEDGVFIVEDTKGMRTPTYRLKKKLMEAIHGIKIRET